MADRSVPRRRWLLALVALAVLGAHAVALREALPRMGLPAAALLVAVVIAKHLGLAAAIRTRRQRRVRH